MDGLDEKRLVPQQGIYVVGVSGGVDSVVLLDLLWRQLGGPQLIVAHINHGLRDDAAADGRFVAGLAQRYGARYEQRDLPDVSHLSEEAGRRARYAFFASVGAAHGADGIITAHHADDVVETIAINLVRGTGWRGLCSLRSRPGVWRPLLSVRKTAVYEYAMRHGLEWCEDSTNHSHDYLRNTLRRRLPALERRQPDLARQLTRLHADQVAVCREIEALLAELVPADMTVLPRRFLELDDVVAAECLRRFLQLAGAPQTRPQLARALAFGRAAATGKRFSLNGRQFLRANREGLVVAA
ncbi:tRNA lysidine(34) synthetase TilS [Candidatus Saccharibacteria bacterium]|nr:tRNA lysidine(34) synthetase TilS [Candidatus Saccharibacteria bacterium]